MRVRRYAAATRERRRGRAPRRRRHRARPRDARGRDRVAHHRAPGVAAVGPRRRRARRGRRELAAARRRRVSARERLPDKCTIRIRPATSCACSRPAAAVGGLHPAEFPLATDVHLRAAHLAEWPLALWIGSAGTGASGCGACSGEMSARFATRPNSASLASRSRTKATTCSPLMAAPRAMSCSALGYERTDRSALERPRACSPPLTGW